MPIESLTRAFAEGGAAYELLPHEHTERAADEAAALGLPPDEVAKTLVVTTPEGNVRAVLPASERIDLRKIAGLAASPRSRSTSRARTRCGVTTRSSTSGGPAARRRPQ